MAKITSDDNNEEEEDEEENDADDDYLNNIDEDARVLYVSSNGNDDNSGTSDEPLASIRKAMGIAGNKEKLVVCISGKITENVSLCRAGLTIFTGKGSVIGRVIVKGGGLVLRGKLSLKHKGVDVYSRFIMEGGSVGYTADCSGVSVNAKGEFIMKGGRILKCGNQDRLFGYGAGVYVHSGGNFIMEGGEIKDNASKYGGAAWVEGLCWMLGGDIYDNYSRDGEVDGSKIFYGNEWEGDDLLNIIQEDGTNLKFFPEEFKTQELCLAAVQQNCKAIQYVPEKFKTAELCLAAVQQDSRALKYVPEELKGQMS